MQVVVGIWTWLDSVVLITYCDGHGDEVTSVTQVVMTVVMRD